MGTINNGNSSALAAFLSALTPNSSGGSVQDNSSFVAQQNANNEQSLQNQTASDQSDLAFTQASQTEKNSASNAKAAIQAEV